MNPSALRLIPLILLIAAAAGLQQATQPQPAMQMATAASAFLDSLSPELRQKAALGFDDPARLDWHFIPRAHAGVTFGDMSPAQRIAARNLIRSVLSSRGTLKVDSIMALDNVLKEMEKAAGGTGASRDALASAIAVFGKPPAAGQAQAADAPWGFRLEGHHISLNFTIPKPGSDIASVSVTPSFLGSNPGEVRVGPDAGKRILAIEEDLGRALVTSLDAKQLAAAIINVTAPADVLTVPGRDLDSATSIGLAYPDMSPPQQAMLLQLLNEYTGNLRFELASIEMDRIKKAGLENLKFAWAGGTTRNTPHYYRITGPTFVIEYDNTQNDANHVHTVWHDKTRNFGRDQLAEHLRDPSHQPTK